MEHCWDGQQQELRSRPGFLLLQAICKPSGISELWPLLPLCRQPRKKAIVMQQILEIAECRCRATHQPQRPYLFQCPIKQGCVGSTVLCPLLSALPALLSISDRYAEAHADEHDGCHHPGLSEELVRTRAIWAIQLIDCTVWGVSKEKLILIYNASIAAASERALLTLMLSIACGWQECTGNGNLPAPNALQRALTNFS